MTGVEARRWRRLAVVLPPLQAVEGPQTYALLRIGLGALVIANVSTIWPHVEYLYGPHGLSPPEQACGVGLARWSLLCHLPEWGPRVFLAAFTAVALAFAFGFKTRATGILTVALYANLWWRSTASWAGEQVFSDFLLPLCLARSGDAYSVDRWLARRRGEGDAGYEPVPSWPRYLMILQLTLCFGVNGWMKSSEAWRSGEAVFYALANERYGRFPPWGLFDLVGAEGMRWVTYFAWVTERGFPLVVLGLLLRSWLRRIEVPAVWLKLADWTVGRRVWATSAALLMLGISLLMSVGWFTLATAVTVLCLFRGEEVGRVLQSAPTSGPARPRARWVTAVVAVFIAWHSWVITTRALHWLVGETVVLPIARAMYHYQLVTNNTQYWAMFSDTGRANTWLRVVAITGDGREYDTPADLEVLDHGRHVKIGYDRRQKLFGKMMDRDGERLAQAHARRVCATWTTPDGTAAVEVRMVRMVEPKLDFTEWFAHSRVDPHELPGMVSREVHLLRVACADPDHVPEDM